MGFLTRRQGLFSAGAVGLGVIALSVVLILAAASSQVPSLPEVSNSELEATGIVLSTLVKKKRAKPRGMPNASPAPPAIRPAKRRHSMPCWQTSPLLRRALFAPVG